MKPRVLFYVQHLLGIGHIKRAALLSKALIRAGFDLHLVQGGAPSPIHFEGAHVHQLPPITCQNGDFSSLVDGNGRSVDDGYKAWRKDQLLALYQTLRPDLVLIELYPFGRRQFRFELIPLLELAHQQATPTVCSLRDILVKKSANKRSRAEESAELINHYFDKVLVHSDPNLVRLEDSFPCTEMINNPIYYTGYIAEKLANSEQTTRHGVVISVGGGAVGYELLHKVMQCKSSTRLANANWRCITGPGLSSARFTELQRMGSENGILVERFRDDFVCLLAQSQLSISQAGYNTTMDILATRTPALVVPYSNGGETEQLQRSHILQQRGYLHLLHEDKLNEAHLVSAINQAALQSFPEIDIDLNGAQQSADYLFESITRPTR
ncbi:hypothetical protein MIB92_04175 [Aestuariirhabdus sp. Z084]|uniref:glycosyltransferase family protein n=1 Tax=Aestuariirhabdus haliotis TaxID=2918751 RepID=UPI00201B44E3|nr:glycosyltransferase [Aestuariirhabdus haliotis]MCL6414836.1 hypothetical protein [Aestuariirhabdus haliotis]MCL6418768.1 hypothetical protein [Aestuariirhabdus haliotis]